MLCFGSRPHRPGKSDLGAREIQMNVKSTHLTNVVLKNFEYGRIGDTASSR